MHEQASVRLHAHIDVVGDSRTWESTESVYVLNFKHLQAQAASSIKRPAFLEKCQQGSDTSSNEEEDRKPPARKRARSQEPKP